MPLDPTDLEKIDRVVRSAVEAEVGRILGGTEPVELANRWTGGKIEIWPRDSAQGAKELPIEDFVHKIVMVRDRLRVLEQQINGHAKLTEEEKVHLQQYVTRCYGSLTTFNVLFKDKADHFKGTRTEKDE
jgi:hypothetical protein